MALQITALVPMKGNSERVPNKNIKSFCGIPLLCKIIQSLLKAKNVEKVVVNTDCPNIINILENYFDKDIDIHIRPESICGDLVPMNDIIKYDLSRLEGEHFLQTHTTNPLLKSKTIDSAIAKYFDNLGNYDSTFSVTKLQTRLFDKNINPINHKFGELIRTQDLDPIFEENSNFYIFSKSSFENSKYNRIGLSPTIYEIDKIESQDIDDWDDFLIAEALYKERESCEP